MRSVTILHDEPGLIVAETDHGIVVCRSVEELLAWGTGFDQFEMTREQSAELLELMERCLLKRVLEQTGGNQSRAAKILGITRASLRHKLQSLHLSMAHAVRIEDHELQGQPDV